MGPRMRLVGLALATVTAAYALLPGATMATTNTHNPPWADIVNGPMWGYWDPRGAAVTAFNYLDDMGYKAFNDNNNVNATTAVGPAWAMDDAVFVVFGHAAPGQIAVQNQGVTGAITAHSGVSLSPDLSAGPRANLYSLPSLYWNKMKLAVWMGCNTGKDADASLPYGGNLVREAYWDMGASASIGFTHLIYAVPPAMDNWTNAFFHALQDYGGTPASVSTAATSGLADVRFWWGYGYYSYGFENPFILGGSTKINPPGYGT